MSSAEETKGRISINVLCKVNLCSLMKTRGVELVLKIVDSKAIVKILKSISKIYNLF